MTTPSPVPSVRTSTGSVIVKVVFVVVWAALGVRLLVTMRHHEPFRDDAPSIELLVFFALSAVIGSRLWLALDTRLARRRAPAT